MPKIKASKNNSPEQKKQWEENKTLVSRFVKITASEDYVPRTKAPSRRDKHRMESGYNKYK